MSRYTRRCSCCGRYVETDERGTIPLSHFADDGGEQ